MSEIERTGELMADIIWDELDERGWSIAELASRMGHTDPKEISVDHLAVELFLACSEDPDILLGDELATGLSNAFGTSKRMWANLDKSRRERLKAGTHDAREARSKEAGDSLSKLP